MATNFVAKFLKLAELTFIRHDGVPKLITESQF